VGHRLLRLPCVPAPNGAGPRCVTGGRHRSVLSWARRVGAGRAPRRALDRSARGARDHDRGLMPGHPSDFRLGPGPEPAGPLRRVVRAGSRHGGHALRAGLRGHCVVVHAGARPGPPYRDPRSRAGKHDLHADRGMAANPGWLAPCGDDPDGCSGSDHQSRCTLGCYVGLRRIRLDRPRAA